jgi:serine/threonine-protein kinase
MNTILVKANTVLGTPDFLAPEQARDVHKADIRSDLYSLGCTFHYLLTGKVPFPGGTTLEKLLRHNTEAPTPVEHYRRDVPAGVLAILNMLLAKKPEERFQTPAELAEALAPFAVSSPAAWSGVHPAAAFEDEQPTPEIADEEGSDALLGTIVPVASATPVSGTGLMSGTQLRGKSKRQRSEAEKWRWRVALVAAVGIVAGLLGALVLVGLFFAGK